MTKAFMTLTLALRVRMGKCSSRGEIETPSFFPAQPHTTTSYSYLYCCVCRTWMTLIAVGQVFNCHAILARQAEKNTYTGTHIDSSQMFTLQNHNSIYPLLPTCRVVTLGFRSSSCETGFITPGPANTQCTNAKKSYICTHTYKKCCTRKCMSSVQWDTTAHTTSPSLTCVIIADIQIV